MTRTPASGNSVPAIGVSLFSLHSLNPRISR
jgi:hypothetical protein